MEMLHAGNYPVLAIDLVILAVGIYLSVLMIRSDLSKSGKNLPIWLSVIGFLLIAVNHVLETVWYGSYFNPEIVHLVHHANNLVGFTFLAVGLTKIVAHEKQSQ